MRRNMLVNTRGCPYFMTKCSCSRHSGDITRRIARARENREWRRHLKEWIKDETD